MTETPDTPAAHPRPRPSRLYQAAAWVGIVAGVVFIVGAVFLTGLALGRHGGDGGCGHHRVGDFRDRMGPPPAMMPMEGPGGRMGPGARPGPGPGAGPGESPAPRPAPAP